MFHFYTITVWKKLLNVRKLGSREPNLVSKSNKVPQIKLIAAALSRKNPFLSFQIGMRKPKGQGDRQLRQRLRSLLRL